MSIDQIPIVLSDWWLDSTWVVKSCERGEADWWSRSQLNLSGALNSIAMNRKHTETEHLPPNGVHSVMAFFTDSSLYIMPPPYITRTSMYLVQITSVNKWNLYYVFWYTYRAQELSTLQLVLNYNFVRHFDVLRLSWVVFSQKSEKKNPSKSHLEIVTHWQEAHYSFHFKI